MDGNETGDDVWEVGHGMCGGHHRCRGWDKRYPYWCGVPKCHGCYTWFILLYGGVLRNVGLLNIVGCVSGWYNVYDMRSVLI